MTFSDNARLPALSTFTAQRVVVPESIIFGFALTVNVPESDGVIVPASPLSVHNSTIIVFVAVP